MPKILMPKETTGTTRFIFDFKLSTSMIIQVLKEFRNEYEEIEGTLDSFKLINKEKKSAVEICKEYISFFPSLSETETESIRKRIYRHIAKRTEVYFSTAEENLELSISSLLTDDLRSCASLLYYALHKFINGSMYHYFNSQLDMEDHTIEIKEIEHFTSANFYLYVNNLNKKRETLTKNNYKNKIFSRKKNVDPFILSEYLFSENIPSNIHQSLLSYIDFLCQVLFEKTYFSADLAGYLDNSLKKFDENKANRDYISQEDEVKAAIAYAILQSKEKDESIWLVHTLALRIYWLRQTADYDFDFEVKTSVREMSILVSTVKSFLEQKPVNDGGNSVFETNITKNGIETNEFSKNETEHFDVKENIIVYYNVDTNFPSYIDIEDNIELFITAVHLDPLFKKENCIYALNLTKYTSNKGSFFIYESQKGFKPRINIHINDDGRWTAWISQDVFATGHLNLFELHNIFNEFLQDFIISYNEYFVTDYHPTLVASYPKYIEDKIDTLGIDSLVSIEDSIYYRKINLEQRIAARIGNKIGSFGGGNTIIINDITIYLNVVLNLRNVMNLVPFKEMFFNRVMEENEYPAVLNIMISEDDKDRADKIISTSKRIFFTLEEEYNLNNTLEAIHTISVSSKGVDNFLEGYEDSFWLGVSDLLNTIAYNRIMDGIINDTEKIINPCLSLPNVDPFIYATKGLWYLRNEDIDLDTAEKEGKELYNTAISLHTNNKDDYLQDLNQKYYYELARFFLLRKADYTQAAENIDLALSIGETGIFFEDVLELQQVFMEIEQESGHVDKEVAASVESVKKTE